MPVFEYICPKCGNRYTKFLSPEDAKKPKLCDCGQELRREKTASKTSSHVLEVLDNGIMTTRLERLAEAETLYAERARNSDPNSGT